MAQETQPGHHVVLAKCEGRIATVDTQEQWRRNLGGRELCMEVETRRLSLFRSVRVAVRVSSCRERCYGPP